MTSERTADPVAVPSASRSASSPDSKRPVISDIAPARPSDSATAPASRPDSPDNSPARPATRSKMLATNSSVSGSVDRAKSPTASRSISHLPSRSIHASGPARSSVGSRAARSGLFPRAITAPLAHLRPIESAAIDASSPSRASIASARRLRPGSPDTAYPARVSRSAAASSATGRSSGGASPEGATTTTRSSSISSGDSGPGEARNTTRNMAPIPGAPPHRGSHDSVNTASPG